MSHVLSHTRLYSRARVARADVSFRRYIGDRADDRRGQIAAVHRADAARAVKCAAGGAFS